MAERATSVETAETLTSQYGVEHTEGRKKQRLRGFLDLARSRSRWLLIVVSILVYLAATVLFFSTTEGWSLVQCIYFAIVVVTTVGYGDFLPTSNRSKIATIVMAHFALIIVAFAISEVVTIVQSKANKALRTDEKGLGIFNKDAAKKRRRYRSLLSFLCYLIILLVGTVVFAIFIDWEKDTGNRWLNGLYLTVITVTTIGFGDFSPAGHPCLKAFGCLLMIIGIPSAASFLTLLTQLIFGEAHEEKHLKVIRDRLTARKFEELNGWVKEMRADGLGNYRNQGENQVSRFEYLCFVLVKNGVVNLSSIKQVMMNLDEIDTTGTGFISLDDVQRSTSHFSKRHTISVVTEVQSERTPLSSIAVESICLDSDPELVQ